MRATIDLFGRLVAIAPNLADDLLTVAINIEDPRHLAYFIASNLRLDPKRSRSCWRSTRSGRSSRR